MTPEKTKYEPSREYQKNIKDEDLDKWKALDRDPEGDRAVDDIAYLYKRMVRGVISDSGIGLPDARVKEDAATMHIDLWPGPRRVIEVARGGSVDLPSGVLRSLMVHGFAIIEKDYRSRFKRLKMYRFQAAHCGNPLVMEMVDKRMKFSFVPPTSYVDHHPYGNEDREGIRIRRALKGAFNTKMRAALMLSEDLLGNICIARSLSTGVTDPIIQTCDNFPEMGKIVASFDDYVNHAHDVWRRMAMPYAPPPDEFAEPPQSDEA